MNFLMYLQKSHSLVYHTLIEIMSRGAHLADNLYKFLFMISHMHAKAFH